MRACSVNLDLQYARVEAGTVVDIVCSAAVVVTQTTLFQTPLCIRY